MFAQTGPSSFGTTCTAVGDAGVGEACAGATACRPGLACLGNGTSGACTQWCYQDSDCGQGGFCNIYVTLATQLGHGAFACSFPTACDPLAPTCTSGDGCYIVNVSGTTLNFGCTTAGAVPAGSTCAASNDCVPGAGCVPEQDGGATCHTFCNPDAGAPSCGSGTCEPVNAAVGVCP